ncbi:hypothetical protein T06_5887 [Trichinella sp. T6]|nr:hypothetical protein T06_5887 [Trichinella sp. T6]
MPGTAVHVTRRDALAACAQPAPSPAPTTPAAAPEAGCEVKSTVTRPEPTAQGLPEDFFLFFALFVL